MIELGHNRYGKSAIRLVKIVRDGSRHTVRDVTVAIALEGGFESAHTAGDNSRVVATDTMKNTVYAMAPEHLTESIESFALTLARHFARIDPVDRARVEIDEHPWRRIESDGAESEDAFVRVGEHTRTTVVDVGSAGETVESGVADLVVMKTARSAFSGFPRDEFTTLRDTDDRILATKVSARWRYGATSIDFDSAREAALATLLAVFAEHRSASVQESIWLMARAMLERHAELEEVWMSLPNLHHWLVDLTPFGLPNENEIFVATSEPYGLIEATVRRGASGPGKGS